MKIKEHYETWQGTGYMTGVRQYFIRTAGCRVACPIRKVCDQQDALAFEGEEMSFSDLWCKGFGRKGASNWVHITGGEPLNQTGLSDFVGACQKQNRKVHLQTSGMVFCDFKPDYLTVSPKGKVEDLRVVHGDELILVTDDWVNAEACNRMMEFTGFTRYYLQPLEVEGKFLIDQTLELLSECEGWRLTGQLHKQWGVR